MKLTQKLKLNKTTKGTYQFTTDDPAAATTSIYIRKTAMPAPPPAEIVITVEYEDAKES